MGTRANVRGGLSICIAVTALVVAASAGARGLAGNGRIGYLRPLGGNEPPYGRLFAIKADGSGATDLTPAGYTDVRSFAWSPNGRRIAFVWNPDGNQELYKVRADGTGMVQLTKTNGISEGAPSWQRAP